MRGVFIWAAAPLVCFALEFPADGNCWADGGCSEDVQVDSLHLLQWGMAANEGSRKARNLDSALAEAKPGREMLNSDPGGTPKSTVTGVVIVICGIAGGSVAGLTVYVGKAPTPVDLVVCTCCILTVVITGIGMWGDVDGGRQDIRSWFSWHPVLMVAAFMCLMVLGRWVYTTESPVGSKAERRRVHRVLMLSVAIVMCFGYYGIFNSHWPVKKFFGYYHLDHTWASWQRILHVYLGYSSIFLTLAQAIMGLVKYEYLKDDQKVFAFHGTLGKVIILLSGGSVIMADWFWGWGSGIKTLLGALTGACIAFGTLWPTPAPTASEPVSITN